VSASNRRNIPWWALLLYRLILIGLAIIMIYVICPLIWGSVTLECVVIVIVLVIVLDGFVPTVTEGS
jgi:hypothetical protein